MYCGRHVVAPAQGGDGGGGGDLCILAYVVRYGLNPVHCIVLWECLPTRALALSSPLGHVRVGLLPALDGMRVGPCRQREVTVPPRPATTTTTTTTAAAGHTRHARNEVLRGTSLPIRGSLYSE